MLPRSEALTGARPEYDLIRVEPKKAKRRERINSARELALCFVSLDRMLLSERSWKHWPSHMILGKQFASQTSQRIQVQYKPFTLHTNTFATCVVSRTLPPKIPFFQCLGDFLAKRYHFLSCRVCCKYLPQFCRPHFYIISLYTCYSCICKMTLTRKWQERVNGWLIYCRGFELLPVFLGFVWQIAFNLSLVSTCQPHFSGNVVWWACRLGLSRGGQTVCRLSPFQSWSELIHPPGLKWRGFIPWNFCVHFSTLPRCRDCSQHWQRYARSKTPDFPSCWDQWRPWNHGEWQLQMCQFHKSPLVLRYVDENLRMLATEVDKAGGWYLFEHPGVIRTRSGIGCSIVWLCNFNSLLCTMPFPVSAWLLFGWVDESITQVLRFQILPWSRSVSRSLVARGVMAHAWGILEVQYRRTWRSDKGKLGLDSLQVSTGDLIKIFSKTRLFFTMKYTQAAAGKLRRDTPSPASPVNTGPVENTSLVFWIRILIGRELYQVVMIQCGSYIEPL